MLLSETTWDRNQGIGELLIESVYIDSDFYLQENCLAMSASYRHIANKKSSKTQIISFTPCKKRL